MSDDEPPKLLCPLCGEALEPRITKCKNCGSTIPKRTREQMLRLIEELNITPEQAQKLYNLGYKKPEDLEGKDLAKVLEEEAKLFLCPECGVFVHEKDEKCPRCGAEFAGEAVEIEDYLIREERPCPHCGEPVHKDAASCPICGKPISEVKGVSLGSTYMCPSCGVTVLEGQRECEVCGANLSPTALIASKALELEGKACPNCGGTLDPETGICPLCSTAKEGETPADEAVDEIDKFLEHLATITPISKAKGKTAEIPEFDRSAEEYVESELAKTEPTVEPEPPETPPEEEEGGEAEGEFVLEELEEEYKKLPMVKILKPSTTKLPQRTPPIRVSAESGRIAMMAEGLLYATALGLSLQLFASRIQNETFSWILFIFFGSIWGFALGTLVLSMRNLKSGLRRGWQQLIGTIVILTVPMHWYLNSAWPQEIDMVLIVVGTALWVPSIIKGRGRGRWLAPWAGGSTIATFMMPASVLTITVGGDLIASLTWVMSAILVLSSVALALQARWIQRTIDMSLQKGEEEFMRREFTKSVEDYDRAIEIAMRSGQGDLAAPWYSKGAALVVLGRYEEALKAIDEALRINPNNEIAWINRGNALSRMGDYKQALKAFNAALKANPRYEVAWNNKGNTLARLGRYKESLKCYDLALQIDPSYRGAWVNKGYVFAKLGEYEEAAKCAEKVMSLSGSLAA